MAVHDIPFAVKSMIPSGESNVTHYFTIQGNIEWDYTDGIYLLKNMKIHEIQVQENYEGVITKTNVEWHVYGDDPSFTDVPE